MTVADPEVALADKGFQSSPGLGQIATMAALLCTAVLVAFDSDYIVWSFDDVKLRPHHAFAAAAFVSSVVWLVRDAPERGVPMRQWPPGRCLCAAAAGCAVLFLASAHGSTFGAVVHQRTADILIVFCVIFAVGVAGRDSGTRTVLLWALAAGVVLAAVAASAAFVLSSDVGLGSRYRGQVTLLGDDDRLTRPFSHANIAAMFFAPAAVSFMAAGLLTESAWRRWWLAGAGWLVSLVALSASRAGVLAVVVGGLCVVLLVRRGVMAVGALILVGLVVAVPMSPALRQRFSDSDRFAATLVGPDDFLLSQQTTVEVFVRNESSEPWPALGRDAVKLTARWRDQRQEREWITQVWPLPNTLAPGEGADVAIQIPLGVPDGSYVVVWDLLLDREAFFLESSGSQVVTNVDVVGSPSTLTGGPVVRTRPTPGRPAIWGWSLELLTERPLFGHGAGNFRFVVNEVAMTERPVSVSHAHNMVLEPLTAWGLVGGVPFVAMLVALGVDMLRRLRSVDALGVIVGSSLIALAVQGLLEWPLMFPPLATMFAMLYALWFLGDRRAA